MDYDELIQLTRDIPLPPAEAHGALTGFLCSGCDFDAVEAEELSYLLPESTGEQVQDLLTAVHADLESVDLDFQPLVPDEDEPLSVRLAALADWCNGFLFGFGVGTDEVVGEHATEILRDVQRISEVDEALVGSQDDDDEDFDEGEFDFVEVYEYVRIAALSLYETALDQEPPSDDDADNDEPDIIH